MTYRAILILLCCFLFYSVNTYAKKRYTLVYIDYLLEQKIGKLIIEEVYKQLNLPVRIVTEPALRSEKSSLHNAVDGEIMRIYDYAKFNPNVIRVPTPYYSVRTTAFVKVNSGIQINTFEDLSKYRIARVRGIKHTLLVSEHAPNVTELTSSEQIVKFVHFGRADVGLSSFIEGMADIKKLGITDIKPIKPPLQTLDVYHYVTKENKHLVPLLDAKLQELKSNGELEKLISIAEQQSANF